MQTPGHATINLAVLTSLTAGLALTGSALGSSGVGPGEGSALSLGPAILLGGIAPDVPIVVLYLRERRRGTPEEVIWTDHYQRRFWQDLVHGMHSIPLSLLGLAAGLLLSLPQVAAFFASTLLHALLDLPVHAHDAHRHFLPLSNYRFISPFSYWDPRYHAPRVALVEALLVAGSSVVLWSRGLGLFGQLALLAVNVFYGITYYRTFLRRGAQQVVPSP